METQLIAQTGVAQQHFHLRCTRRLIHFVRGLPADDMFGTLGHDGLVTHLVELIRQFVGIEQLGVPNGLCLHAENGLQQRCLFLELLFHLALVVFGSQRIAVRSS